MVFILKHIDIEGPGIFSNFLNLTGLRTEIYEVYECQSMPGLDSCRGILVMGGPMNVYELDQYPFLKKEEDFLKDAIGRKIPIIGICLGAQILAKINGARIYRSEEKEIGWHKVYLTADGRKDPLFQGLQESMTVFQWHEDTFDIPENGLLLAKGKKVKNQALRFSDYAWGLQYHPEITSALIRSWVKKSGEKLDLKKMMQDYFSHQDIYLKQAKKICFNFAGIIKKNKL
ncbi:MAG: type 1 glutamine amidotransferase [Candidatus Omnitrophica bacterium]|nr:type 1 glutamine amidotransferase [Candidatus Omnitrophota bacterium]